MDEWINQRINKQRNELMVNERMNKWMNKQVNRWNYKGIITVRLH